jgi:hypothetical protein
MQTGLRASRRTILVKERQREVDEQVGEERKKVAVLLGDTVEAAIVHSQVERTVFNFDEKDWGRWLRTERDE